jgi:hypothetical protein
VDRSGDGAGDDDLASGRGHWCLRG